MLINVIPHNATEWKRMAADLKTRGYIDEAWDMAVASVRSLMSVSEFDTIQNKYREWLNNGHTLYPKR